MAAVRKEVVALVATANLVVAVVAVNWAQGRPESASLPPSAAPTAWDALDAQARCDSAAELLRRPNPWPTICHWRAAGQDLRGQSFPPPGGDPPWDRPRIEVYLGATEGRAEVAHIIAHELGHMHHTRNADFGPRWLQARGLAPELPWTVWTEDYAEVFAALYGPPVEGWQAPTTRPSPGALAALAAQFFTP